MSKETLPQSEFENLLWNAVITEQLIGIQGLQTEIIRRYNVQLEFDYGQRKRT